MFASEFRARGGVGGGDHGGDNDDDGGGDGGGSGGSGVSGSGSGGTTSCQNTELRSRTRPEPNSSATGNGLSQTVSSCSLNLGRWRGLPFRVQAASCLLPKGSIPPSGGVVMYLSRLFLGAALSTSRMPAVVGVFLEVAMRH